MMTVAGIFRKRGTIAGAQNALPAVLDEDQLAFEHVSELVLVAVPVALARPTAGRQGHEIDAEISKASGIA